MADFHLWSKDTLVSFAERASKRLLELEDENAELRVKLLRVEVKNHLAQSGSGDTIKTSSPETPP